MSVVATDLDTAVSDAAAHLYVWALKDIPQDLRDARGPHDIPLVEHARAGGADARTVLELLEATEVPS